MLEKYLLSDVFDAWFFNSKGELICMSQNLTQSDITGTSDTVEVRNGRGNALFAMLQHNKNIEVKLATNVFDFHTLALQTGSQVATGEGTSFTAPYTTKVVNGLVPIPQIPMDSDVSRVNIFCNDARIIPTEPFAIDEVNGCILLNTDLYDGKEVFVNPFEYELSEEDAKVIQEIVVRADSFTKAGKLLLRGWLKNQDTADIKELIIVFDKAQPISNFNLVTTSEVSPSETEITLNALSDKGKMVKMIIEPVDYANFDIDAFDASTIVNSRSVSNLKAVINATDKSKVDLTWTAPSDATGVKLQVMFEGGSWADVNTSGGSSTSIPAELDNTSTSVTVSNLTIGSYAFRLVVTGGDLAGNSNCAMIEVV